MVQVGDIVQFTAAFCKSIGAVTGTIPFAQGKVTEVSGSFATVEWEGSEAPSKVNVANLKRVSDWEPN